MIDVEKYRDMVRGPGKFEGEPPEVAYFWEVSLDGDGEIIADMVNDGFWAAEFIVTPEEASALNLTAGNVFVLVEDSQGFVSGHVR